jgi:hypothetical protein
MISELPSFPYNEFKLDSALKLSGRSPVRPLNERSLGKKLKFKIKILYSSMRKKKKNIFVRKR